MGRQEVTIRQEGPKVLLLIDGRAVLDMPWDAAIEVGRAFIEQARKAEEVTKALSIAGDQALLIRLGVPIGLTSHPSIQAEAAELAQSDPELRRYLPGGVKSKEVFGEPRVIRHPPRRKDNGQGLQ